MSPADPPPITHERSRRPRIAYDRRVSRQQAIGSGAVAGLIAGIVMILAAMVYMTVATPMEPSLSIKNVAATWYGAEALLGGWVVLSIGLLTHLVVSLLYGMLFGAIVGSSIRAGAAILAGLLYATAIWAIMTWWLMPAVNPVMTARVGALPAWWWWTLHAIYGFVLALTPSFLRSPAAGSAAGRLAAA